MPCLQTPALLTCFWAHGASLWGGVDMNAASCLCAVSLAPRASGISLAPSGWLPARLEARGDTRPSMGGCVQRGEQRALTRWPPGGLVTAPSCVCPRRTLPGRTEQMFSGQSDHSSAPPLGTGGDRTFIREQRLIPLTLVLSQPLGVLCRTSDS